MHKRAYSLNSVRHGKLPSARFKLDDFDDPQYEPKYKPAARRPLQRTSTRLNRYIYLTIVAILLLLGLRHTGKQDHEYGAQTAKDRYRLWSTSKRGSHWPGWENINRIFAFGDSHTDTGFKPHSSQPSHFNPLGNPYFPGRTFNYGHNYLGHLTATFNESFIRTYSLAKEHSVVARRENSSWTEPPLREQIDNVFLSHYGRSHGRSPFWRNTMWSQNETLFVFFAGTDDLVDEFANRNKSEARNVRLDEALLDEYRASLQKIYSYGARNFLIISFPHVEEAPVIRMQEFERTGSMKFGSELVNLNGRLAFMINDFAERHPDATVFYFDSYSLGVSIRHNPSTFQETAKITRLEGYCYPYAERRDVLDTNQEICGNSLEEFYWRDGEHQTEPYHRVMARLITEKMKDKSNWLPLEFP